MEKSIGTVSNRRDSLYLQKIYWIQTIQPQQACKVRFIIQKSMRFYYDPHLLFVTMLANLRLLKVLHPSTMLQERMNIQNISSMRFQSTISLREVIFRRIDISRQYPQQKVMEPCNYAPRQKGSFPPTAEVKQRMSM